MLKEEEKNFNFTRVFINRFYNEFTFNIKLCTISVVLFVKSIMVLFVKSIMVLFVKKSVFYNWLPFMQHHFDFLFSILCNPGNVSPRG